MSSLSIFSAIHFFLTVVPLYLFVRQDVRNWQVRESTLLAMLGVLPAFAILGYWQHGWYFPVLGAVTFLASAIGVRIFAVWFYETEAFGPADVVLAVFCGAALGWKAVLLWWLIGINFSIGYFAYISLRRRRRAKRRWRHIPAGPGFAVACVVLLALELLGIYRGFPFSL